MKHPSCVACAGIEPAPGASFDLCAAHAFELLCACDPEADLASVPVASQEPAPAPTERVVRPEFADLDPRDLDYAEQLVADGETPGEAARRAQAARGGRGHDHSYQRRDAHQVPRGRFAAASLAQSRGESVFEVAV